MATTSKKTTEGKTFGPSGKFELQQSTKDATSYNALINLSESDVAALADMVARAKQGEDVPYVNEYGGKLWLSFYAYPKAAGKGTNKRADTKGTIAFQQNLQSVPPAAVPQQAPAAQAPAAQAPAVDPAMVAAIAAALKAQG